MRLNMRDFALTVFLFVQVTNTYSTATINTLKCLPWDAPCLAALAPTVRYSPRTLNLNKFNVDTYEVEYYKIEKDLLEFECKNTKIQGMNEVIIDELSVDTSTNILHMKFHTDMFATGLYKTNGSLFSMPVDGEGSYSASFKNMVMDVYAPFKVIKDYNGEDIIEASNYEFAIDVKDNAEFHVSNLHYGFTGFSEMLQYLANYNWKYITSTYVTEFVEKAAEQRAHSFKGYFSLNPLQFLYYK